MQQEFVGRLDDILRQGCPSVAPAIVCRIEKGSTGEILFERAYGTTSAPELDDGSNINQASATTTDTVFDLASLTKLFTTTAFLRLVDAGVCSLDQPVAEVLPEFGGRRCIGAAEHPITKEPLPAEGKWAGLSPVDASAITFRQLLTHSSGLPAWRSIYKQCGEVPPPMLATTCHDHARNWQQELRTRQQKAFEAVTKYDFFTPPTTTYAYSDIGLILLGFAIARMMRKMNRSDGESEGFYTIADAIDELVSRPLGLGVVFNPLLSSLSSSSSTATPKTTTTTTTTTTATTTTTTTTTDTATAITNNNIAPTEFCAWRKRRLRGEVHDENAAGMGGVAGHAGLFGTARDVCRLGRLYMSNNNNNNENNDDNYDDGKHALLSKEIIKESRKEHVRAPEDGTRRGLGWMLQSPVANPHFSVDSFGHTGYTGTSLWCDPARDVVVVLLTNRVFNTRNSEGILGLRAAVHKIVADAFPLLC